MILTTERLTMRLHEMADFGVYRQFWMSDRTEHIGGPLTHEHEVWRQFSAECGHWELRGFGLWTLIARDLGAVMGGVGLQQPPHHDAPELAWHLTGEAEGKGLAAEAARAALAHGRRILGIGRVISYVAAANARSMRLAERLGGVITARGQSFGTDYALYDHPQVAE